MEPDTIITVINSPENWVRFLAIIISVVIAILVLIANQYFANKRERKKIICEKIEEFYEASISYTKACDELITDIQLMKYKRENGYYDNDPVIYSQLVDSLIKMEMLQGLYFPNMDFKKENYSIDKMPIIWDAISGEMARRTSDVETSYKKSRKHVETSSEHFREICILLMQKTKI